MRKLTVALLGFLSFAGAITGSRTVAADRTASIPSGWRVSPYFFAGSEHGAAVALFPIDSDPFTAGSRILQVVDGTIRFTSLPGKATGAEYSRNGAYLLVRHEDSRVPKTTLISAATGEALWTKSDKRSYRFSGTGEVVYAVQRWSEDAVATNRVEIFGLDGVSQKVVSPAKVVSEPTLVVDTVEEVSQVAAPGTVIEKGSITLDTGTDKIEIVNSPARMTAAAVLGNGASVLMTTGDSLKLLNVSDAPMILASLPLRASEGFPGGNPLLSSLEPIGVSGAILKGEMGRFKIVAANGTVVHTYDPYSRAAQDPTHPMQYYAACDPFETPDPNKLILLHAGTASGFLLDLTTSSMSGFALDVSVPEGFVRLPGIKGMKTVFASSAQILIRDVTL